MSLVSSRSPLTLVNCTLVMPAYDITLWDFLKYASYIKKGQSEIDDFFPLKDRLEMSLRILDGLLYMNEKELAHRDIKLRSV